MTKNDFYAGREVCILHNTSNSIGFDQDKIRYQKGTVLTVGRKYITVASGTYQIQFDIDDNFREKTAYAQTYWLFLNEEAAQEMLKRQVVLRKLRQLPDIWRNMSDQELKLADEFLIERKPPLFCAICVTESYVWNAFGETKESAVVNLKKLYDNFIIGKDDPDYDLNAFQKEYQIKVFPVSCNSGNVIDL